MARTSRTVVVRARKARRRVQALRAPVWPKRCRRTGCEDDDEDGEDVEPEDDFNAAWEVLDLARAIYEKQSDGDDLVKLKLADTYMTLGDVSLETGVSVVYTRATRPVLITRSCREI